MKTFRPYLNAILYGAALFFSLLVLSHVNFFGIEPVVKAFLAGLCLALSRMP